MKEKQTGTNAAKSSLWQPTHYSNLIRYIPSDTYFARVRVSGKLIRKSLHTDIISVAKLRLADFVKEEREAAASNNDGSRGQMTFGDCVKLFLDQTNSSNLLKPKSKIYRTEAIDSIKKSWPGIETRDVRQISVTQCETWAAKLSGNYSPSRYNGVLGVFRKVFEVAIESGALYRNPAQKIKRAKVLLPHLDLPDFAQFELFVKEIESANGRDSKKCADMVRFLAFGGFRLSEARNITWNDCDFKKDEIVVRGDMETGTKNWSIRRVPMIPEMRQFLERLQKQNPGEKDRPVLPIKECLQAMTRAAKVIGMTRITHHHLRHLFATRCIESGVDIPTVSRWLGHRDGGALAMRVYGHLRQQHSVAMAQKVRFSEPEKTNGVTNVKKL